ncbi:hypothetical protein BH11CYA1_BH11CYA1_35230 [soil metagenome]
MLNGYFNTALGAALIFGVAGWSGPGWCAEPVKTEAEYQAELKQVDAKLAAKPSDPGALYRHAFLMGRLKRFEGEVNEAKKLTAKYPTWRDAYVLEVNGHAGLNHNLVAIEVLNKVFELAPPTANLLALKGSLLCKEKKYAEGLVVLNQSIKLNPDDPDAYDSRVACNYGLYGACPQVISDLENVMRIKPSDKGAAELLANFKKELNSKTKGNLGSRVTN